MHDRTTQTSRTARAAEEKPPDRVTVRRPGAYTSSVFGATTVSPLLPLGQPPRGWVGGMTRTAPVLFQPPVSGTAARTTFGIRLRAVRNRRGTPGQPDDLESNPNGRKVSLPDRFCPPGHRKRRHLRHRLGTALRVLQRCKMVKNNSKQQPLM